MKFLFVVLVFLAACSKPKPEEAAAPAPRVDNTVVRYTSALQQDVQKAKAAQVKANQAIADTQSAVQNAQKAME